MQFTSKLRDLGLAILIAAVLGLPFGAQAAEKVEVAPGVMVTKKSYPVPVNEQPFFGFVKKNSTMEEADRNFVAAILRKGSAEKGQDAVLGMGWRAFHSGDYSTAAKRFNQAYLLDPSRSGVYEAFAAIAQVRFGDKEYAEELSSVAKKLIR